MLRGVRPIGSWVMLIRLVDMLKPGDRGEFRREDILFARKGFLDGLDERLVDEARFSRAGNAGDDDEFPQGEFDIDLLQVVFVRPFDFDELPVPLAANRGDGDVFFAGKVLTGDRGFARFEAGFVALVNEFAPVHPAPGPMSTR